MTSFAVALLHPTRGTHRNKCFAYSSCIAFGALTHLLAGTFNGLNSPDYILSPCCSVVIRGRLSLDDISDAQHQHSVHGGSE